MTPADFAAVQAGFQVRLAQVLPGHAASGPLAPDARLDIEAAREAGCREAAALVLLFPGESGPATVLTLRSAHMRQHAGQIALPGGAVDDGESVEDAALREAREELGLAAALIIHGRLSPLHIPPSGFCLSPVVASAARRPTLVPHPREVADVLDVELDALVADGARKQEERIIGGQRRTIEYYHLAGHKVWGATGLVLTELAAVWLDVRAALAS